MTSTRPNIFTDHQDKFYEYFIECFMESEISKRITEVVIDNYEEKVEKIKEGSLIMVDYNPFFDWFKHNSDILKYINPILELDQGNNMVTFDKGMYLVDQMHKYLFSEIRTWSITKGHPVSIAKPKNKKQKVNTCDYVNKYTAKVNKPSG
jgi:hypothetical protein